MFKTVATIAVWSAMTLTILHLAFNPDSGVVYSNPFAAPALALIGFGLCFEARKRATAATPSEASERPLR